MAVASPRQQLDRLLSDRAQVEQRLRQPGWEHVLTGAGVGLGVLTVLLTGSLPGIVGGFLLTSLAGSVEWWRDTRTGLHRGTRFGGGWRIPVLGGVLVALVGIAGVVAAFRLGDEHPGIAVGLPLGAALMALVGSWATDRWRATRDVVRHDFAPAWQEGLEDPVRLRLAMLLATADMRADTLQGLSGLDESALAGHLAGLEAGSWISSKLKRSMVVEDATWCELTHVGRGGLARHLAELDRLSRPTFHT